MANLNDNNLKLAIQKSGRLTDETLEFLKKSGLEFESYKQRLFSNCRNFPLEILFVRDDDIPDYVQSGAVDMGIIGLNVKEEEQPDVKTLLELGYGICSLMLSVPNESDIQDLADLQNKKIATTYPNSLKSFLKQNRINARIVKIKGSVEITPAMGIADAIADLVSTGSTLALNDLRKLYKIFDSQAVLIANKDSLQDRRKEDLISKLMIRFQAVMAAKSYKYVMMNAPEQILTKVIEIVPGLKSPTVAPLAKKGWISIQTVIREDIFWETIEKLKQAGAQGIIVLPIEKIII